MSTSDFWPLLFFKVRCRLKSESRTSYLNYGWWVVEPILHMAIFYLVFAILMNRGTENFVVFLLCGLIPWLWFSKSVSNSTSSISTGRNIMMQTRIPLALFPAEVVLQDAVKQLAVFILFILFILIYGLQPTVHWFAVIPIAAVQLVFTCSVAFLVSAMVPFLPDVRYLVQTALLLMMFGSGIFYRFELILPEHRSLFFMNPMANLINNYREVFLNNHWPDWTSLGYILLASCMVLALIIWIFDKFSTTYVRVVLES